jgi:hypothetical protein
VGEFEGDVGVRVRRHATWNMERHLVTRRDPGMETCLFSSLLVVDEFSPHTSDTSGDEDRMVGCVGVTGVCLLHSVPGWYRHSHFVLSFFLPRRGSMEHGAGGS